MQARMWPMGPEAITRATSSSLPPMRRTRTGMNEPAKNVAPSMPATRSSLKLRRSGSTGGPVSPERHSATTPTRGDGANANAGCDVADRFARRRR